MSSYKLLFFFNGLLCYGYTLLYQSCFVKKFFTFFNHALFPGKIRCPLKIIRRSLIHVIIISTLLLIHLKNTCISQTFRLFYLHAFLFCHHLISTDRNYTRKKKEPFGIIITERFFLLKQLCVFSLCISNMIHIYSIFNQSVNRYMLTTYDHSISLFI